MADKDIGGGGKEDEELVEEVARTKVGEKVGFVAGRRTTAVGDMLRGGAMWKIERTGKDALYNDTFKATKIRDAPEPPPATRQMSEREMIIDADARRQAQLAQYRLNQAARDAEAKAVEATGRAKRVNTAKAWAYAEKMLEEAKKAKAKVKPN